MSAQRVTLSTIAEESSFATTPSMRSTFTKRSSRRSGHGSLEVRSGVEEAKLRFDLPPLHERVTPHRDTSRKITVPRVFTRHRSPSMREELMFRIRATKRPLFSTVVNEPKTKIQAPILALAGYRLGIVESLYKALDTKEHDKLQNVASSQIERSKTSRSGSFIVGSDSPTSQSSPSFTSRHTSETPTSAGVLNKFSAHKRLSSLLGLPEDEGDESDLGGTFLDAEDGPALTESTRQARIYLRVHKIFEFFVFIICHLLSAYPKDPIKFILDLLEKCLLCRSGLNNAPLLYDRHHLECLYNMMDRMCTGAIDLQQYETGMRTLGIRLYLPKPSTTKDGLVQKEDFIEDAYQCLLDGLDDLLRPRWIGTVPRQVTSECTTHKTSTVSSSCMSESESTRFPTARLFLDCT